MTDAPIRTDGLTKRFDEDVVAVDDLDLRVEDGEVFGFLGPNGAGKSTVINLLLDFVRPTAGSATVLGHDPRTDAEQIRRRTGVLPEGASLYERLTGREHVQWVARATEVAVDDDALLDRVGISPSDAERAVGGYSKGMRKRLALGMALVGDPELLILDEPSAGLDPTGRRQFRDVVRSVATDGRTVFYSSHVLDEVEAVCDRIGILNDGRLVATGAPDALRADLDLGGTIAFEVTHVPDALALDEVAGVESVTVEDATITVSVSDSRAKIRVATALAARTQVLDVVSDGASLETLFASYTETAGRHLESRDERTLRSGEVSR